MSKARGLADLGNAFSDGALSNRNLIINGEFLISQRNDYTSSTVMTDNVYTVDRWKTYRGAGSATFQDMGGSLKLTASSAYTGTLSIRQHVEWVNLKTRVGQTFTLSAYMKTTSSNARLLTYDGSGWSTGSTPHSGSGNWEIVTFTFTMPDASSYGSLLVAVGIDGVDSANVSIANGENVEIKQVQLEVGDTATPFEHRSYSDELARCQRYYFMLASGDEKTMPTGSYYLSNLVTMPVQFPVTMRSAPSLDSPTGTDYYGIYRAGAFDSFTSFSGIGRSSVNGITLDSNNRGASGTAGHSGPLKTDNADAYVAFDAEL